MSELAHTPSLAGEHELREPRLHERLAVLFASDIVSGRMPPAQTFPSAEEIVNRFGVSRTVARETVQTLSMLGLVRVRHGKRSEILPVEHWDILSSVVQQALLRENQAGPLIRDLYELRLVLEPQSAAWMAERADEADQAELRTISAHITEFARAAAAAERVLAADRDFHNLIARASGNRVLAAVARDIREVLSTLWALSRLRSDDLRQVAAQHETIVAAILARDSRAAAEAMTKHLLWARDADVALIEEPMPTSDREEAAS